MILKIDHQTPRVNSITQIMLIKIKSLLLEMVQLLERVTDMETVGKDPGTIQMTVTKVEDQGKSNLL
jgi:hypothetical protein